MTKTFLVCLLAVIAILAAGWVVGPSDMLDTLLRHIIPPATILTKEETGECWRIMDWTTMRLLHCDVVHPVPTDMETVDATARQRWLQHRGG